jgi:hypothetical protein
MLSRKSGAPQQRAGHLILTTRARHTCGWMPQKLMVSRTEGQSKAIGEFGGEVPASGLLFQRFLDLQRRQRLLDPGAVPSLIR